MAGNGPVTLLVGAVLFGLCAGIASGLLGIGGGTLMVPFLVLAAGLSQQEANATSLLVVVPTAVVGTWALRRRGVGDLKLSLRLGLFGVAGGVAGALLALVLPSESLRIVFAVFLTYSGARMVRNGLRARRAAATLD